IGMKSRAGSEIEHEILISNVTMAEGILIAGFYNLVSAVSGDIQVHIIKQRIGYFKKQLHDLLAGIVNRKTEPVRGWSESEIQGFRSGSGPSRFIDYLV